MKALFTFLLLAVAASVTVAQGEGQSLSQSEREKVVQDLPDLPQRLMHTPHTPGLLRLSLHPSFYDRKSEWRTIINQFWGPGEGLAGKLATFDLYQSYARAYNSTFVWNPVNWDSTAAALRSRINDTTSRGEFSRILTDLAFALRDGHAYAMDTVMVRTPLNPGTPILVDGGVDIRHFGAGLTPLDDGTLLTYKVVSGHPLGLVPGDIILGYQGIPWKQLMGELLTGGVPHTLWLGAAPSARVYNSLWAAGVNWHLFDTIDVRKYNTGQVLHLPLGSMLNLNVTTPMFNTEQLPIPGVPMPVFDLSRGAVKYGIIQGTNIGYIYVYHHGDPAVSPEFDAAVQSLMGTDGLIIDIRFNLGGSYGLNSGMSRLMNHSTQTLDVVRRCSNGDLYSLCPYNASFWLGEIPADIGTFYDRPIAVLLGPNCLSYGDITSWQFSFISNARTFGRSPQAIYSGMWGITQPSRSGYYLRCPNFTLVDHFAPNAPRWGEEYPIDEEVWLTPDDVAIGDDTVVKRAKAWIEHAAYASRVRVASTYSRPGLDSNTVTARLRNPDGHTTRLVAFIRNHAEELIDSLRLFDDGLHDDSLANDGLYGARIAPPAREDRFSVSLTTYDLSNGRPYKLTRAAHYFSNGPIVSKGWSSLTADTILYPGDVRYLKFRLANSGVLDTVNNVTARVSRLDTMIFLYPIIQLSYGDLRPGQESDGTSAQALRIQSTCPPNTKARLLLSISSEGTPIWTDTVSIMVQPTGIAHENTLPTEYSLSQNYPNPFNPSTVITYELPAPSQVRLSVYDLLGREVAVLVNEKLTAGRHRATWDASMSPSGVYFYRLDAGSVVQTKKMLFTK